MGTIRPLIKRENGMSYYECASPNCNNLTVGRRCKACAYKKGAPLSKRYAKKRYRDNNGKS